MGKKMPSEKELANLKPFKKGEDTEAMREGRRLGVEANKRKADMRRAMEMLMNMPATGKVKEMLEQMGYDKNDQTNSNAIAATLYAKALQGDNKSLEMILQYFFQASDDERKTKESNARIDALAKNGVDISVNSGDDDGGVVIYLPKIEEEESKE